MKLFRKPSPTLLLLLLFFTVSEYAYAQKQKQLNSAEIELALKKLNVLGSVLYLAAHPDDENTRLISYFANEELYRTAYLSLTRGDGGQNLVGPELREKLGVIRTQELLAARRTDGGEQYFTRANDFGYSKTAEETLEFWNEKEVLADMVWVIRNFKPDIIVTRFQGGNRKTHGHHTASAILAKKAFELAADKSAYPEQLKYVDVWKTKRILFNTSWWFYGGKEEFDAADKSDLTNVDVGMYNPLLGKSYGEIAAESRSMHKSQGFGASGSRGSTLEYMELLDGNKVKAHAMEGINTEWSRIKGTEKVQELCKKAFYVFDGTLPHNTVPILLEARKELQLIKNEYWKKVKTEEIDKIIQSCLGLYLQASTPNNILNAGSRIEVNIEAVNRSPININITNITFPYSYLDSTISWNLMQNQKIEHNTSILIPNNSEYSDPYWLKESHGEGMYTVNDQLLIGTPENKPAVPVIFSVNINGTEIKIPTQLIYTTTDPVKGEIVKPCIIVPELLVQIEDPVYILTDNKPKTIKVNLKTPSKSMKGQLVLAVPRGWRVEPINQIFSLKANDNQNLTFSIIPPPNNFTGTVRAAAVCEGKTFSKDLTIIEYDHIPTQMVLDDAQSKLIKTDLITKGNKIAYIMGAGDQVPESLNLIGYEVIQLTEKDITSENLKQYDAVITGIRAYNTNDYLETKTKVLHEYVQHGGTVIVQYNTNHRLVTENIAPYPLKLSRDRVTEENAVVTIVNADHTVLNYPNKITVQDFDGWVQERGLYFPNEWDSNFESVISCNDKNEEAKTGSLLVAKYGEGYFIYSGISWFRQLPAGVPGAYRLFTNMISIGKK